MNLVFAKQALILLQHYIVSLSYKPVIHFELEGCYAFSEKEKDGKKTLNFTAVNNILASLNIDGELVAEYWSNQWEYVSKFNGQTPFKEAKNLAFVIQNLPNILAKQGITKTLIKPVVWSGDQGKLGNNCQNIFSTDSRAVHIPNAIQINVSLLNERNENLVAETNFGEFLQQSFLNTSLACCLLYLPEEEAFERLQLKGRYGLDKELCSPDNISGGHQGSIALYKKLGKHNQLMGAKPLIYDQYNNALINEYNWQETARVEHRLGASSVHYCPYVNVVFALLNIIDALENFTANSLVDIKEKNNKSNALVSNTLSHSLPHSLKRNVLGRGAIELFEQECWFAQRINTIQESFSGQIQEQLKAENVAENLPEKLGDTLKSSILKSYKNVNEIIFN